MRPPSRRLLVLLAAGLATLAVGASVASAHIHYAGGGPDTLLGHPHIDTLHGGAGCDVIAGRPSNDTVTGGYSGCDVVRGQDGNYDNVDTDDNLGGDRAYGGAGGADWCWVDPSDGAGVSCDRVIN